MANYLDPPGRRLAYDADGTVVTAYRTDTGAVVELSTAQKQAMNDEGSGYYAFMAGYTNNIVAHLGFYFPGPRNITHLFLSYTYRESGTLLGIDWSPDSANPQDGSWTTISYTQNASGIVIPNYRSDPSGFVASGVKALRFRWKTASLHGGEARIAALHVYAHRSPTDTSRQVAFCSSSGARIPKDFDFQDRPRGGTYKWKLPNVYNQSTELYVKNYSTTETANNVVVGQEALTGTMHNNIRISTDDATYTQTITIPSLAPGAMFGPIFVRWTPPSNDQLGVQTMRIPVTVGSWS